MSSVAGSLSSLQVEVHEVQNANIQGTLFLSCQLGDTRLRAFVRRKTEPAEAIVFTHKDLVDLYSQTLHLTLVHKDTNTPLGRGSMPVRKLVIGKKVDHIFELSSLTPEPESTSRNPPIRLRLTLELLGSLRPEFRFLSKVVHKYQITVDRGLEGLSNAGSNVSPYVRNKYAYVLMVPLGLLLVGAIPFVGIAVTIGLPIFFPLILIGGVAGIALLLVALAVGFSSRSGRERLSHLADPIVKKLTNTSTGQQLLYETGPRPGISKVARTFMPKDKWARLGLSLALDFIGSSSYIVPLLGEFTDLAWAPTQALIMAAMYSEKQPLMPYLGLLEELLPFTDIIPSATLAWLRENVISTAGDLTKTSGGRVSGAAPPAAGGAQRTGPPPGQRTFQSN